MKKRWIYKVVSLGTIVMLTSGAVADSVSEATALPTAQISPDPMQYTPAPVENTPDSPQTESEPTPEVQPTEVPAPTEAPAATEVPSTPTPVPTERPAPSVTPSASPEGTPAPSPTNGPSPTMEPSTSPSASPEASAAPSVSPSASPEASIEPSPSPEPQFVIVAFAPLASTEVTLPEKPPLEQVLSVLPTELEAEFADGQTRSVPVAWNCADYETEAESYAFQAQPTLENYALGEGVSLPVFTVKIQPSQEISWGDCTFFIEEDGTLTLTAYTGQSDVVNIPEQVEGKTVRKIAATAFSGQTTVREITLAHGISVLEAGAFANCSSLKKLVLPDSLEEVGGGLLDGCGALEFLQLNISMESSTPDGKGYTRQILEADGTIREIRVALDREFTDYNVLSGGSWHVKGALRIEAGHSATIVSGGSVHLAPEGSMIVNGAMHCSGSSVNEGKIIACGGAVSGIDGEIIREHSWSENGECTVCGAHQSTVLNVSLIAGQLEKTYDGTSGLDLGAEDFQIEGIREGDEVYIAVINTNFNQSNAGNYLASVSFELGGSNAQEYSVLPMEISVVIHKKQVTVTPRSGQSKVYGASDPTIRAGYRGVVSGETLSGRLGRESGESVGTYRITMGTLEESNPNYEILLGEETFAITPKPLSSASVTVGRIPNQRYTGGAITPTVEVHDGNTQLRQNTDYQLSYEGNVEVGSAQVTITGMGNYGGSRQVSFRIIKVGSGSGEGFGPSSGFGLGIVNPDGETIGADGTVIHSEGNLRINGQDLGGVLFDADGNLHPFEQSSRTEGEGEEMHRYLTIEANEETNAVGEPIEGVYNQPRLRLSMEIISILREAGYSDVELCVGELLMRVPLSTLYAEYVQQEGILQVNAYEIRLWPISSEEMTEHEQRALEGYIPAAQPCHLEMLALPQADAETGETPAAQDVLSLLDGVRLLIAPQNQPDYQNLPYVIVRAELEDPEMIPLPEGADFIMEQSVVKSVVTPLAGGMYALATAGQ